jgi:hypothetical protein
MVVELLDGVAAPGCLWLCGRVRCGGGQAESESRCRAETVPALVESGVKYGLSASSEVSRRLSLAIGSMLPRRGVLVECGVNTAHAVASEACDYAGPSRLTAHENRQPTGLAFPESRCATVA